jgi:septal ring factor EnvC (AmiA/AmiB activator)
MRKIIIVVSMLSLFLPIAQTISYAQDTTSSANAANSAYESKLKEIEDLKKKITDVQGQAQTLQSAITLLNNKEALTQKQIEATQFQIELLQREIDSLTGKIGVLEGTLNSLTSTLLHNVQVSYKTQDLNGLEALLSTSGYGDLLSRYKYLMMAQQYRQDLLLKTTQTRFAYDQEKTSKEKKQQAIEELKKKYVKQKQDLVNQEKAKQELLKETKNNESNYQRLLSQALAEIKAVEGALASGVQVGPVKRGDVIALVGNSGYPGCSSAKHLHFEVRKNNSWVDPTPFLKNKSIIDEQEGRTVSIGSGNWDWPIQDPIRLTQHFGHTPWSFRYAYSGGNHTGFDMVSKSSDIIRAPADGTLYKSSEKCGSSTINIVFIDHGDNVKSFYLHVQ